MNNLTMLVTEAKNKLDEIQEATTRLPAPRTARERAADFVYSVWEPVAAAEGQAGCLDQWIHNLRTRVTELEAAGVQKKGTRKVLDKLSDVRKEVLEILGARSGEGSRDAARRVVEERDTLLARNARLEKELTRIRRKVLDQSTAVSVYEELNDLAEAAGYGQGSVLAYVAGLRHQEAKRSKSRKAAR